MHVAVIGASGVVGRALLDHLQQAAIPCTGYSRRAPDLTGVDHRSLDLMDASACRAAAAAMTDTTHLVYTALFEKPGLLEGWVDEEQMQTNLQMLKNLLEPLRTSSSLRHITLLQGTKAYGAHIQPVRIPGKEREPRVEHPNFYWLQEDYATEVARDTGWTVTIWRPQIIFGHALGAPMNMLAAIGAYAAIRQYRGEPFAWPGGTAGIMEATCADLLARAMAFSFDNPAFANQTFNVTNGDVFTFENVWDAMAEALGVDVGEPERQRLADLYNEEDTWQALVQRHRLIPCTLREFVGDSFYYADALLNTFGRDAPPPALVSTIKLRQAGFGDCLDTEDMLANWFARLRRMKRLP